MITRERIQQIRANNDARNWPWRPDGIWQKLPREAQITETFELLDALDEREELLVEAYCELKTATSRCAQNVRHWIVDCLRGGRFEVK